jgi:hypothetical protein
MYLAIMYLGKATGLLMQQVNLFEINPLDATKCSTIMLCNLSKYALVIEIDVRKGSNKMYLVAITGVLPQQCEI